MDRNVRVNRLECVVCLLRRRHCCVQEHWSIRALPFGRFVKRDRGAYRFRGICGGDPMTQETLLFLFLFLQYQHSHQLHIVWLPRVRIIITCHNNSSRPVDRSSESGAVEINFASFIPPKRPSFQHDINFECFAFDPVDER